MRLREHYSEFQIKEYKKWREPTLFIKAGPVKDPKNLSFQKLQPLMIVSAKPLDPINHSAAVDFNTHSREAQRKRVNIWEYKKINNRPEQQKITSKPMNQFLHSYVHIVLTCSQDFMKNNILSNLSRTNCTKTITKTYGLPTISAIIKCVILS